jgi:PIN domain nuclease of toxin-antitoxin system
MILLIDTHIFIWWAAGDRKLTDHINDYISDPENTVYVGAPTIWEITTKRRLRKLDFEGSPVTEVINSGFENLPVLSEDAEIAGNLAWDHKDPFDRLLVAQAVRRAATLVTADSIIRDYGKIPILWAK